MKQVNNNTNSIVIDIPAKTVNNQTGAKHAAIITTTLEAIPSFTTM